MTHPAYPAARAAAARVLPHFMAQHSVPAPAALPDLDQIEAMIDAAFWTSLRREEGLTPRLSLAFVGPEQLEAAVTLENALPLSPAALARVAPAVERPGIHLAVWPSPNGLAVWGATRNLPPFCFVLEVVAAGLLVIKHNRGDDSGKFVNVAVLEGDQIKVVDHESAALPDCPSLLTSLLGLESHFHSTDSVNVLIQLAVSIRAHGRGGSLLVVSDANEDWRQSIARPMLYSVLPPFSALAELKDEEAERHPERHWQDALRRAVDGIAGLTAVDGATIINTRYELLAFGAKIVRRPGALPVDRVMLTEPIEGAVAQIIEPAQLGGTRHLSAAQFAQDQREAIALVASQDGRFTVFGWSPCESLVHAHRIESLLL